MVPRIPFILLTCLCVAGAVRDDAQEGRQTAVSIWEQAVAAKGGRDRLAGIRSFAIRKKTRFRGFMTRDVARGKVDQIVCELPDQWWEFLDYRPGLMGYSLEVVDVRSGMGWRSLGGGPARPLPGPNRSLADRMRQHVAYRMRQLQYVYFLETRSTRPDPQRASRVWLGFRRADRVETEIEDDLVIFFLDLNTHLPVRIETVQTVAYVRARGGKAVSERRYIYELDGYHEVAGIQVPARVTLGGDRAEARVEINPGYEPSLFKIPPPAGAGIDSWRRTDQKK